MKPIAGKKKREKNNVISMFLSFRDGDDRSRQSAVCTEGRREGGQELLSVLRHAQSPQTRTEASLHGPLVLKRDTTQKAPCSPDPNLKNGLWRPASLSQPRFPTVAPSVSADVAPTSVPSLTL